MKPFFESDIKLKELEKPKNNILSRKRKRKKACYVLITCEEPNEDGKMQVEMTYEGEPSLAAYLLENAQSILNDRLTVSDFAS